jgi:hypothetical protein
MFCCSVWCTLLLNLTKHAQQVQVFTKIGNTFVCNVDKTCIKSSPNLQALQAYLVLRYIQDQVARNLKHDYLPSRYLAIYIGSVRLTKPDFPFVDKLDAQESSQVLGALQGALRIDVVYDEADTFDHAKRWEGNALREGHILYIDPDAKAVTTRRTLIVPEVEVWTFKGPIKKIVFCSTEADTFGDFGMFPSLRVLAMNLGSKLSKPDMADLAPCTMLEALELNLVEPPRNALVGISKLTNLKKLHVSFFSGNQGLPRHSCEVDLFPEITKLTKLEDLRMDGTQIHGAIPKEIGKLTCLTSLKMFGTSLSSIPKEIDQLVNLKYLVLFDNPLLVGQLPNFKRLVRMQLQRTPHVGVHNLTHGSWDERRTTWRQN